MFGSAIIAEVVVGGKGFINVPDFLALVDLAMVAEVVECPEGVLLLLLRS